MTATLTLKALVNVLGFSGTSGHPTDFDRIRRQVQYLSPTGLNQSAGRESIPRPAPYEDAGLSVDIPDQSVSTPGFEPTIYWPLSDAVYQTLRTF